MEKALGRLLKNEFTLVLVAKDDNRDDFYWGFRDHITSQTHNRKSADKQAAAIKLYTFLDDLGFGLASLGFVDETAKLNTLIAKCKTAEYTALIATVGATEWFTDLEAAQIDFETTYNSKTDKEGDENIPFLKDSKKLVKAALKPLLAYVESNVLVNEAVFKPIESQIDEIITDIVTIAHARITRKANEKKEEEKK
jgi:hypothetical protein